MLLMESHKTLIFRLLSELFCGGLEPFEKKVIKKE